MSGVYGTLTPLVLSIESCVKTRNNIGQCSMSDNTNSYYIYCDDLGACIN